MNGALKKQKSGVKRSNALLDGKHSFLIAWKNIKFCLFLLHYHLIFKILCSIIIYNGIHIARIMPWCRINKFQTHLKRYMLSRNRQKKIERLFPLYQSHILRLTLVSVFIKWPVVTLPTRSANYESYCGAIHWFRLSQVTENKEKNEVIFSEIEKSVLRTRFQQFLQGGYFVLSTFSIDFHFPRRIFIRLRGAKLDSHLNLPLVSREPKFSL